MKNKFKKIQNHIVPFLILVSIIVVIFIHKNYLSIKTSGDLILLMTFLALLWYSYETRKTRINSERLTEISFTPVVALELVENRAAGYRFKLKNVGIGLALSIKITENTLICRNNIYPLKDDAQKRKIPEFEIPYFLHPKQEEILKPKQKGEQDLWIINQPGIIEIVYKNLEGKDFSKKFKITERCRDEKQYTYYQIEVID